MSGYGSSSYGSSGYGGGSYGEGDSTRVRAEQQQYVAAVQQEQQRALVQQVISKLTEVCWNKCVTSTSSGMGSREKTCVENCSKRYIDASSFVQARLQNKGK
jgi:import inner membrane translocase subunit TIM8